MSYERNGLRGIGEEAAGDTWDVTAKKFFSTINEGAKTYNAVTGNTPQVNYTPQPEKSYMMYYIAGGVAVLGLAAWWWMRRK